MKGIHEEKYEDFFLQKFMWFYWYGNNIEMLLTFF